jgi:predicted acylesterase/phospholipase RssA
LFVAAFIVANVPLHPILYDDNVVCGIVNNFPVEELKKLGVDIIIGVNVQDDLTCNLSFSEKRVAPVLFEDTNNFYLKQASSYFSSNKKLPFYLSNSFGNNELKDLLIGNEVYDLKINESFMVGDKKFSSVAPKKIEKNVSFNTKIEKVKKFKVKRIRFRLDISNL